MNHLPRLAPAPTLCRNRLPSLPVSSAIGSRGTRMHVVRRFATVVLMAFSFAGVGWSNAAHSSLITYTLTGGTINGTLNGVAFSNASFTMTATANPNAFIITNDSIGGVTEYRQAATTTMTMPGFSPFQITTPTWGPWIVDYSAALANLWYGGFAARLPSETFGASATTLSGVTGDVIYGDGSLTGFFGMTPRTYSTTAGDLVISGQSDQGATFTSSTAAVPEIDPSCLGSVLALIGGGLGLLERRRRAP